MDNNNASLLLQLLTNPSALQQVLATVTQSQQQSSSIPETTLPVPSNAIIGIVNTAASNYYYIKYNLYNNTNFK
jgi:hypothetical protein